MAESEVVTPKKAKPKAEKQQVFTNTGKRNVFTEKGRVLPGGTVTLLPSVANLYENLKRKQ